MAEIISTIEDAGPACKKITVTAPAEVINERLEGAFANYQQHAALPGFRSGRAPRRLIEQKFGTSLRDDIRQQLISEGYQDALKTHNLDPISYPEPVGEMPTELPEKGDLVVTLQVEITPDVTLPDFKTLKVEETEVSVDQNEVEKEIQTLKTRFGRPEKVEGEAAIEKDMLECQIKIWEKGSEDGEPLETSAEDKPNYVAIHGEENEYKGHVAGIIVPELGKKLVGKNVGESLRVETEGPKRHENASLCEKTLTIEFNIAGIHRTVDASAEDVAQMYGCENADELKGKIEEQLLARATNEAKTAQHKAITDQLIDAVELELPEKITSGQTDRLLSRKRMEEMYKGTSAEDIEAKLADLRNESEEEAKRQMKSFFILDKASKDMEIEVDDDEINMQIYQMAMQQQRRPDKLMKELGKNGGMEQIYLQIREHKTLDTILNTITGKTETAETKETVEA